MKVTFFCPGRADWSTVVGMLRLADEQGIDARVAVCSDWEFISREATRECFSERLVSLNAEQTLIGENSVSAIARIIRSLQTELAANPPDIFMLSGDRFELLAALAVAVPMRVPLGHISGGDCTFGTLGEQVRHATTKAAHVHFVANALFASRLRQMGEEAGRIHITGDPGLDCLFRADLASPSELETLLDIAPGAKTILVAFHPVIDDPVRTWTDWESIEKALADYDGPIVVTGCNSDPQGDELRLKQESWGTARSNRRYRAHLGQRNFLGLLKAGACLVGNSSAGFWEAPSLGAPAINLGRRQEGRLRGENVIDVASGDTAGLQAALEQAQLAEWRLRLPLAKNPYGDGHTSPRIMEILRQLPPREELLNKRFVDQKP